MKKTKYVFTVTRLDAHDEGLGYVEAIFDTAESAKAYLQTRIDIYRRKHKKGYGGRWCKWYGEVADDDIAEAEIRDGEGSYYTLLIERRVLYSEEDVEELECAW